MSVINSNMGGEVSVNTGDLTVNETPATSATENRIDIDGIDNFTIPAGQLFIEFKNMGGSANGQITINGEGLDIGKTYKFETSLDKTTTPNRQIKSKEVVVLTNGATVQGYYYS